MSRQALIVWGGWDGHAPKEVAEVFRDILTTEGFDCQVSDTLAAFTETDLTSLSLIVPIWTMGEISNEQCQAVVNAVCEHGVGLAGCHGGMCDAFRSNTDWQFMTGGQWVAHPGNDGVEYTINVRAGHEITEGIVDFPVKSEQYYLHVDPGVNVLATTKFPHPDHPGPHSGNPCDLPQVWTKSFGKGRVFYSALGHQPETIDNGPSRELLRRGCLWATR